MKKYVKSGTNLDTVDDLFDFLADMHDSIDNLMDYVITVYGLPDEIYGVDISELYKANKELYDAAYKVADVIIDVHKAINKMD